MRQGRNWDDKTFRALLHDHRPPGADAALRARIETAARQAPPVGEASRFRPWPALGRAAALAAGLALVIGLAWLAMLQGSRFDQAMTISELSAGTAGTRTAERALGLASAPGQTLRVSGPGLVIELAPSTSFELAPVPAPQRWLGGEAIHFRLLTGSVRFSHQTGAASFVLATPFGELRPLGTEFSLQVDAERQDLAVGQGRVEFRETAGRLTIVEAGQNLRLQRLAGGGVEQVVAAAPASAANPLPAASATPTATPAALLAAVSPQASAPAGKSVEPRLSRLWRRAIPGASAGQILFPPSGQGMAALVVVAIRDRLSAHDLRDGATLWTKTLAAKPQSLVAGSGLIVQGGTSLQVLDWSSGETRWAATSPPQSLNRPVDVSGSVWLASVDGSLSQFAAADGDAGSRFQLDTGLYGTPLVADAYILTSRLPDQFLALDRRTGAPLWSFTAAARFAGDLPLANRDGSLVWVRDSGGTWYGLETATGRQRFRLGGSARLQFGPVPAAGRLWAEDDGGPFGLDDQGLRRDLAGQPGSLLAVGEVPSLPGRLLVAGTAGAGWLDADRAVWTSLQTASWRQAAAMGPYLASVDADDTVTVWKVVP